MRGIPLSIRSATLFVVVAAMGAASAATSRADEGDGPKLEFFEKKVRPLLAEACFNCHSANNNSRGGLRVDDRQGLLVGGERGAAIVPHDPENSLLLAAVTHADPELKMPPEKRLSDEQVADLRRWIADGAVWPQEALPEDIGVFEEYYADLRQSHWSWQPLTNPTVPQVGQREWAQTDIDRFVLAKLQENSLAPVGDAAPGDWLRRITFDLTGLPPAPQQLDAFLADAAQSSLEAAMETVIERLLASPAFGERFGRHWLDVARYGESTGSARNLPYPHAWRYRDYVIDSFNADKPFQQFLREQIAGDLLPANSPREKTEQLIATGFLALGVKDVNQRFKVRFTMDNVDEQIDTVTRAVLGLSVSCARCHDHKFDPIPTSEYYALAGIFTSTELCDALRNQMGGGGLAYYVPERLILLGDQQGPSVEDQPKIAAARQALKAAQAELVKRRNAFRKEGGKELQAQLAEARAAQQQKQAELAALIDPAVNGPVAMGVREAPAVGDTQIRIRGEAENLGPIVPRGFLSVVGTSEPPPINPEQSGRLELARWLTTSAIPLTSRVYVNRLWHHLFGQGLVRTVDNFGVTGDSPSHPELLDHLATRFVNEGWSTKKLVGAIVRSRVYRLAASAEATGMQSDPENRLLWRHSPRRLTAEELRDAMLAAAGQLDLSRPAASPAQNLKVIEVGNNGPEAKAIERAARASRHRSVYLPLVRGQTPTSLAVFDFAEQGMVTGSRDETTVAPQALYMLNDPFVRQMSLSLAEGLLGQVGLTEEQRVEAAYRAILGRLPTTAETRRTHDYLSEYRSVWMETSSLAAAPASPAPAASETISTGDANVPAPAPKANAAPADEAMEPRSGEAAAWASFCQALFASAEFRYLK